MISIFNLLLINLARVHIHTQLRERKKEKKRKKERKRHLKSNSSTPQYLKNGISITFKTQYWALGTSPFLETTCILYLILQIRLLQVQFEVLQLFFKNLTEDTIQV